jgi:hypothetical protein
MVTTQRGSTTLYVLDLLCTFLAIGLIGFSLYILPHIFGLRYYEVPEFITSTEIYLESAHSLNGVMLAGAIFSPIFVAGIAFVFIARIIAFYVETHAPEPGVPHVDREEYEEHVADEKRRHRSIIVPIIVILSLMGLVIGALFVAEYYLVFSITR